MNLNIKKVSVPVLMFLMAQSGFGVSNENFGNANRALGQSNLNRAVRCLTDEAIKKDEASGGNDHAELKKLLVGSTTPQKIGAMLKEAYIEYLVPRNNAENVRKALKESDNSVDAKVAALVDTNLFKKHDEAGEEKYLWWTIDGYDKTEDQLTGTIKGKFNAVVKEILDGTSDNYNWKDISGENKDDQKKINATLLMEAITDAAKTGTDKNPIAGLIEEDFKNGGWEIPENAESIPDNWKWNSVLDAINGIVSEIGNDRSKATHEEKESIIDALQVFLGDRLMDKLIDAGKSEEEDVREALKNFFKGHFMRKVTRVGGEQDISETSFENALREVNDIMSDAAGDDNDKKERIYNITFDAIFDTIEGLLRSKDAPVSIDMFKDGGIFSDTFKKTLVNQLDNLAPDVGETKNRSWDKIENTNLGKQIKRIVWIDNDDNDVAGAKESDNESYDYDSSDINGGDSDEEQAERAEEAVEEGLENADKLIDNQ